MSYKRLLSEIVESRAVAKPQAIFANVPKNNAYANGYRNVTNSSLLTAIDHVAALITSKFGPSKNFERIAYLGLNDLRYTIVLLAGIKTGYTMFFPSPRNSEEAHVALLASLECSRMIKTSPGPTGVPIVESVTSEKLIIPTLDELLDLDPKHVRVVTHQKSFDDAKTDPIFVLHTSGSTGIPKPLTYTNEYVARMYNAQALIPPVGFESVNNQLQSGACLVTLPPFHIAGLAFTLLVPALYGSIPVYPTAGTPPTLDVFLGALNVTSIDWAFLSPVVVDEIGKDPTVLEIVTSKLDHLFFTGGSVPRESGMAIARKMGLNQVLGSSECAAFPLLRDKRGDRTEDWHYVHVHPEANVEFRHRYDNYYEMVQVRGHERYQPVFCHFGDVDAYETKDLFSKHSTLPDTYSYEGRLDDIIVFINGEKTNPVDFQGRVASHPEVRAALVIGQQREEAALLVEPADRQTLSEVAKRQLVESIWPTVEECNSLCPRHAKVSKTKIMIAPAHMPFLRAGKGTVQRQSTLALFESSIDCLYREDDKVVISSGVDGGPESLAIEDVVAVVSRLVSSKCAVSSPTSDFFSGGMDSRQAIQLCQELRTEFPSVLTTTRTIYSNPTIHSLASSIVQASSGNPAENQQVDDVGQILQQYLSRIDALSVDGAVYLDGTNDDKIEKSANGYESTTGLTDRTSRDLSQLPVEGVILLTGSTGALGSHLLNTMLERGHRMIY